MEYRHMSKMRGTKKLLWNWNNSKFHLPMDCLIYYNMNSCNKQWNTLPQLWNLSIFHSSIEFHGIQWNSPEVPWNSMEFYGTFPGQKGSSMEFHGTLKVPWNWMPWNSMESSYLELKFHGIPWNFKKSMEFGYITKFHGIPWNNYNQLRSSMEFHGIPIPSWEFSWNSMKLRKFHGTWIERNSIEL